MERQRSPHTFSALAYGDYRLLWLGYLISNTGTWMQTFALGWYVVQLAQQEGTPERGPLYLGLVGASRAIPSLIAGFFAGAVSDSIDRRKLLMAVQVGSGAIAAVLAVLALSGDLPLGPILIATALTGMLGPFDTAARQGMLPSMVPSTVLTSGVGLLIGTQNVATLLGPLVGGVSINWIGVGGVLMCNAVSYVAVIGAVLLMSPVKGTTKRASANVFRAMKEGLAYVWREPVIRPLFLLLVLASVTGRALTQMLPAVAEDTLQVGAIELSWLLAAAGVGALIGSIVSASLGSFHRHGFLVLTAAAVSGVLLVVLAVQKLFIPALLLVGVSAFTLQLHIVGHVTVYQLRTPEEFRGRVVGTSSTLAGSTQALGALVLGTLGSLFGVNVAIGLGGLALAGGAAVLLLISPPLRDEGTERDRDLQRVMALESVHST